MSLPPGWRLRLDPGTRRIAARSQPARVDRGPEGGTVLVGGAPLRLLRLNEAGAAALDQWEAGGEIGRSAGRQRLARRLLAVGLAHPIPTIPAGRAAATDVTVVIPVYPDASELAMTLDRLGPVASCIVVDDSTGDPQVAEVAERRGARCEVLAVNGGPSVARNTGWRLAGSEVVAFIDPSCTPEPGWLDALLPHFDDPEVVAVAPRITTRADPSLSPALQAYERARGSLDRGPAESSVRPGSRVPFVPTAALLVRRDALEAVGGFDEDLRFGEDVDLVWRLIAAGGTVRYEPTVEVAHGSRRTAGAWLRQRFAYGGSAARLSTRHGEAVAPLAVSAWTAGAWALIGLGFPVAGLAVAAGSAAGLAPKLEGLADPWPEALRLAGLGHLYGGLRVADALRRPWWPIALAAALVSRRARRAVLAAATVPLLVEWWQQRPVGLGPARWVAVRLADDVAYGAGVWAGCRREGSFAALAPDLTSWPGRAKAVEQG